MIRVLLKSRKSVWVVVMNIEKLEELRKSELVT